MLPIGVLMPRSTLYPSYGLHILNGLKQQLKQLGIFNDCTFFIDNIGFGVDEKEVYTKAEKMILIDEVDIVIIMADTRITEMLAPLFEASNKIMLVVNMGANFPDTWQAQPTTITHSLNFCFHTWLTGALAATQQNKEVANVLSYYDGGYRQCYCMLHSNQINGGIPKYNHVTHLKLTEFTLAPLQQFLSENAATKSMLCLFAGEQAEKFCEEIMPLQKQFGLQLFIAPMMFDEALIKKLTAELTVENAQGYLPWHSSFNNIENEEFVTAIQTHQKSEPNYFYLLGWETGSIVKEIYNQFNANQTNAAFIVEQLCIHEFKSPRGSFKIDAASHHSFGSSFLGLLNNNFQFQVLNELQNIDQQWEQFKLNTNIGSEGSGWKNTYLCI
jgi:branched-chain amino acid transport system substrate-binding protein